MKYVYEYEESLQQCETSLTKHRTELLTYSKCQEPSLSESNERNQVFAVMKQKRDTSEENNSPLKSEYDDLTRHCESLSSCEDDFTKKSFKYLERQEALRLKFLQIIDECESGNTLDKNHDGFPAAFDAESHEPKSSVMSAALKMYDLLSSDLGDDVAEEEEFNAATLLGFQKVGEFVSSNRNVTSTSSSSEMSADFETYDPLSSDNVDDEFNSATLFGLEEVSEFMSSNRHVNVVSLSDLNQLVLCNICGRDFKTEDFLRRHMFVHDEQKRFIYAESRKSFEKLLSMKERVLKYNSEYICIVCRKSFREKVKLKQHELAHFFKNLLECSTCSKYFKSHSALTAHQWSHDWHYCYCAYCNRRYRSKTSLVYHIRRQHLPNFNFVKYACNICGKTFFLDSDRKRHERNIHNLRRK
ncbi:myoneurin-like [Planococcus citri]|uniref:myoneurin-like n=1 Tax=Planococcus citri TaxID=170843 RepID=UPI0031F8C256